MSDPSQRAVDQLRPLLRGAHRVVFVTGAGLSVASGIAAYRTGEGAVWSSFVTDWGTTERMRADPHAWWTKFWLRALGDVAADVKPNPGHTALTALVAQGARHTLITQNIDGLHRDAGLDAEALIEIHGRRDRFICTNRACAHHALQPFTHLDLSCLDRGDAPRCAACGSLVRPLVLLFDELYASHPSFQSDRAMRLLRYADVIVFVGTSFSVGITESALHFGRTGEARMFNINVEPSPVALGLTDIVGRAEEVLPLLVGAGAAR